MGAWLVAGLGLLACLFGIVLAIIPPAQVAEEVGSPVTYVVVIVAIIVVTFAICFGVYQASKRHHWADPNNVFAPFTWQIEGLKKPQKVLSNVPSELMSEGQNPMGMPIKKLWNPNEQIVLPDEYVPGKHHPSSPAIEAGDDPAAMNHPVKTSGTSIGALGAIPLSQPAMISEKAGIGTSATVGLKKAAPVEGTEPVRLDTKVPAAPADEVAAEPVPRDPAADAKRAAAAEAAALTAEKSSQAKAHAEAVAAEALEQQVEADSDLVSARREVKEAKAAADQARKAARGAGAETAAAPEKAAGTASDAGATKGGDAADGAAGTAGADDAGAAKGSSK